MERVLTLQLNKFVLKHTCTYVQATPVDRDTSLRSMADLQQQAERHP